MLEYLGNAGHIVRLEENLRYAKTANKYLQALLVKATSENARLRKENQVLRREMASFDDGMDKLLAEFDVKLDGKDTHVS